MPTDPSAPPLPTLEEMKRRRRKNRLSGSLSTLMRAGHWREVDPMTERGKKIEVRIAAHPVQVKLANLVVGYRMGSHHGIDGMSLREIGERVGEASPQKIKHHLNQLVKYGFLDIVGGKYRLGKALNAD